MLTTHANAHSFNVGNFELLVGTANLFSQEGWNVAANYRDCLEWSAETDVALWSELEGVAG